MTGSASCSRAVGGKQRPRAHGRRECAGAGWSSQSREKGPALLEESAELRRIKLLASFIFILHWRHESEGCATHCGPQAGFCKNERARAGKRGESEEELSVTAQCSISLGRSIATVGGSSGRAVRRAAPLSGLARETLQAGGRGSTK